MELVLPSGVESDTMKYLDYGTLLGPEGTVVYDILQDNLFFETSCTRGVLPRMNHRDYLVGIRSGKTTARSLRTAQWTRASNNKLCS